MSFADLKEEVKDALISDKIVGKLEELVRTHRWRDKGLTATIKRLKVSVLVSMSSVSFPATTLSCH